MTPPPPSTWTPSGPLSPARRTAFWLRLPIAPAQAAIMVAPLVVLALPVLPHPFPLPWS